MEVKQIPLSKIKPAEYNPRTLTKEEFAGLKTSIETFGQVENLVVNKDGTLISGHQRFEVMKSLGWKTAAAHQVDLNKRQEKKLNITMNNQAIAGAWDSIKLSEILEELKSDDDYESLRLNKLEPLDLSGLNQTSLDDGEAPKNQEYETGGGIKQYTIVFDTIDQQDIFMEWVQGLRAAYPDGETIAERIILAIQP
jgi:hypothetical protein